MIIVKPWIKTLLWIIGFIVLFVLFSSFKSGKYALLGFAISILLILIIAIFSFSGLKEGLSDFRLRYSFPLICKALTIIFYSVYIFIAVVILFMSKDLFLDLISGPQPLTLYNVRKDYYTTHGSRGSSYSHYKIQGVDSEGRDYDFEISAFDCKKVDGENITVKYYKHTNRIYSFGG